MSSCASSVDLSPVRISTMSTDGLRDPLVMNYIAQNSTQDMMYALDRSPSSRDLQTRARPTIAVDKSSVRAAAVITGPNGDTISVGSFDDKNDLHDKASMNSASTSATSRTHSCLLLRQWDCRRVAWTRGNPNLSLSLVHKCATAHSIHWTSSIYRISVARLR